MVSSTYQCHNREPTSLLRGGNEKAQGGKLVLMESVIPILSLNLVIRCRTFFYCSFIFEALLQINMNRTEPPIPKAFCLRNISPKC